MILEIKISYVNLGWPLANKLYKRNSQEFDHFKDTSAPTHLDPSIKLVSNQAKAINRHIPKLSMYAMYCTKPDTSYVVSALSKCNSNSGKEHWKPL